LKHTFGEIYLTFDEKEPFGGTGSESFLEDVEKEQEVIVKEEKAKILKAGVKKTGMLSKTNFSSLRNKI
jgi:hypothetical protein